MYAKIQVVIDAADPAKLADFWAFALDYVLEPPPHGFETWEDFGRSVGMPEEEFGPWIRRGCPSHVVIAT
jgi:Glyoxalase-like domain